MGKDERMTAKDARVKQHEQDVAKVSMLVEQAKRIGRGGEGSSFDDRVASVIYTAIYYGRNTALPMGTFEGEPEPQDSSYAADALRDAQSSYSIPLPDFDTSEFIREAVDRASETLARASGAQVPESVSEGHEDPTEGFDAVSALKGWWEQTAHDEIAGLTAKMVEYGGLERATDLEDIGRALVAAGVLPDQNRDSSSQSQELGIYFYLVGKFSRWTAAIREGRPVSDDTLHDIGIYVRMAQRVRAVGGWPV